MFGDINLSKGGPGNSPKGGDHQAGAGGWPTFKYFNKKTGFSGSHYATDDKKTQLPMCDETGPNCSGHDDCKGQSGLMQSYIEEKAKTSLCSSKPPFKGCAPADKEKMKDVSTCPVVPALPPPVLLLVALRLAALSRLRMQLVFAHYCKKPAAGA